jgi:CBS-domain-containing membrane protein
VVGMITDLMLEARVDRLLVFDESGCLVGVISLADLVREADRERGISDRGVTRAEVGKVLATLSNVGRGPRFTQPNLPVGRIARSERAS